MVTIEKLLDWTGIQDETILRVVLEGTYMLSRGDYDADRVRALMKTVGYEHSQSLYTAIHRILQEHACGESYWKPVNDVVKASEKTEPARRKREFTSLEKFLCLPVRYQFILAEGLGIRLPDEFVHEEFDATKFVRRALDRNLIDALGLKAETYYALWRQGSKQDQEDGATNPVELHPPKPDWGKELGKFEKGLENLINVQSIEGFVNAPDYVLAAYLVRCLRAYRILHPEELELGNREVHPAVKEPETCDDMVATI